MRVFTSHIIDFEWERSRGLTKSVALAVGAPVAAALGLLTVKASIKFAFQRSVNHHEKFGRLDTYIVQPNPRYIEQCLQTDELKKYIGDRSDWSFFMITGIRVARVGERSDESKSSVEVGGGPDVEIPTVGTVKATIEKTVEKEEKMEQGKISDFVWAVRLAKVHKGLLMTDWSCDPYTHRATFDMGSAQQVDVGAVVRNEGLDSFKVIEDDDLDEAILLDAEQWSDN